MASPLPALLAATVLLATLVAGCTAGPGAVQHVEITASQVAPDGSTQRTLECGSRADVEVVPGVASTGSLTVQVHTGGGRLVYNQQFEGHDGRVATALVGNSGVWSVTVHRSLEYGGQFSVVLRC